MVCSKRILLREHLYKLVLVSTLFLSITKLHAQQIVLSGVIQDQLQQPISNVHIIAISTTSDVHSTFAVSDAKGNYKVKLFIDQAYTVTIHHLGYHLNTMKITSENKDMQRNISLSENIHALDEIVIKHVLPISFKKDTITFQTDAFTTGKERKLRDVLKRLPMFEVDRKGNVFVQGKKVNKLLVENKTFFTGDSKLAVNNIPADVVDTIEVLENYNEIGFLKELEENEDIALNIQLKENKKKFVFGDVGLGAGIENRYLLHPSLYYYGSNTSVNSIVDMNNTGSKPFTFTDFLEFEGDVSTLLTNAKSYFSFLNDSFVEFSRNQDLIESSDAFGAFSLAQTITSNIDLSTYAIWSGTRNKAENQTVNTYVSDDNLIEDRRSKREQTNRFGIGKLELKLRSNRNSDLRFRTFVKVSTNHSKEKTLTRTEGQPRAIHTETNADNISFKEDVEWHQQITKKQTISTVFEYHFQKATPKTSWFTDETILQGLLPVIDEDSYAIYKVKKGCSHTLNTAMKYYWVVNNSNHMYVTLGSQIALDHFETSEYQQLESGTIHSFSEAGFENDITVHFQDVFIGLHYKAQKDNITLKPGLFYHFYNWKTLQPGKELQHNKGILLPEVAINIEFNSTKNLHFKYDLNTRFPNISQLSDGLTLLSFNSIYQGNVQLKNELYHHFRIRYNRFSMFKDLWYTFNMSYRVKEANVKNAMKIQGIDVVASPLLSDFEDTVWTVRGDLKKGIGKYKVALFGNMSLAKYETPINTERVSNTSNNYLVGTSIQTEFHNSLHLEVGYTASISAYSANTSSIFHTDVFSIFLEYDFLKDVRFKADYTFEKYSNKANDVKSTFDVANTSLFYQKEDSPWGFEISATNILDTAFKQRNSFSSILVSDEKTFILPRRVMFKLSYKL